MIQQDKIEWLEYPVSEETLTPEQARIALAHEKATFGSCLSRVTPQGDTQALVNGKWYRILAAN